MAKAKSVLYMFLGVIVLVGIGFIVVNNYEFIFSRHVVGEIIGVERVALPVAIVNTQGTQSNENLYAFAVAIRAADGTIHSASSDDRQWAVAKAGLCVDAVFYPYAPWDLVKRGTYHNARLIQLQDCPAKASMPMGTQSVQATAAVATPGAEGVATPSPNATPVAVSPATTH